MRNGADVTRRNGRDERVSAKAIKRPDCLNRQMPARRQSSTLGEACAANLAGPSERKQNGRGK